MDKMPTFIAVLLRTIFGKFRAGWHGDASAFSAADRMLKSPDHPFGQRSVQSGRLTRPCLASVSAIAIASLASPAMASSDPRSKLVRCGNESCLKVSGHRDDPKAIVSINGHQVSVKGRRDWKVRLPVETVRQWSLPRARTIMVSYRDPDTHFETSSAADLPIGLLGHRGDLASLVVSVR